MGCIGEQTSEKAAPDLSMLLAGLSGGGDMCFPRGPFGRPTTPSPVPKALVPVEVPVNMAASASEAVLGNDQPQVDANTECHELREQVKPEIKDFIKDMQTSKGVVQQVARLLLEMKNIGDKRIDELDVPALLKEAADTLIVMNTCNQDFKEWTSKTYVETHKECARAMKQADATLTQLSTTLSQMKAAKASHGIETAKQRRKLTSEHKKRVGELGPDLGTCTGLILQRFKEKKTCGVVTGSWGAVADWADPFTSSDPPPLDKVLCAFGTRFNRKVDAVKKEGHGMIVINTKEVQWFETLEWVPEALAKNHKPDMVTGENAGGSPFAFAVNGAKIKMDQEPLPFMCFPTSIANIGEHPLTVIGVMAQTLNPKAHPYP